VSQTKESAQQCLAAGTELTLLDQTLDVYEALNKEQLQQKADLKHGAQKSRDSRNLYLVKEGGQYLYGTQLNLIDLDPLNYCVWLSGTFLFIMLLSTQCNLFYLYEKLEILCQVLLGKLKINFPPRNLLLFSYSYTGFSCACVRNSGKNIIQLLF
jgi:hypothetical protein